MVSKALRAPAVVRSVAFMAIEAEAEKIHAAFDQARASLPSRLDPGFAAAYDNVRQLRQQLAAIDARSTAQFHADNPQWVKHWGLTV